jgi:hypothetical protein
MVARGGSCKRQFTLSEAQETLFMSMQEKKQPVALTCPLCGRTWLKTFAESKETQSHPQYRCPVSHCSGWVDYIQPQRSKPFWGCGACGSRWFDVENLFKEIQAITVCHTYRKRCYTRTSSGKWLPVPLSKQPSDYEEKVEREPYGEQGDFRRG